MICGAKATMIPIAPTMIPWLRPSELWDGWLIAAQMIPNSAIRPPIQLHIQKISQGLDFCKVFARRTCVSYDSETENNAQDNKSKLRSINKGGNDYDKDERKNNRKMEMQGVFLEQ